jgi:hypothetical protein
VSTTAVRCSKHSGMYARTGHSHVSCVHAGCLSKPIGDRIVCNTHLSGPSELQVALDDAYALLRAHGTVKFILNPEVSHAW